MRNLERHAVGKVDSAILIEAATDPNPETGVNAKYDFYLKACGQWQKSPSSIKFHESPQAKAGHVPPPRDQPQEADPGPNGVTNEALIAVLIDRLQAFQKGMCACRENAIALTKLEEALLWLQKRSQDRVRRGVEGQMVP